MVRYHEYSAPKNEILESCRNILLSLDYEIDLYSTKSYSLTTKSTRVRRTLRRYDYVIFLQVTDKIEVHISNIYNREEFRKNSFISPVVNGIIAGFGTQVYQVAISSLKYL